MQSTSAVCAHTVSTLLPLLKNALDDVTRAAPEQTLVRTMPFSTVLSNWPFSMSFPETISEYIISPSSRSSMLALSETLFTSESSMVSQHGQSILFSLKEQETARSSVSAMPAILQRFILMTFLVFGCWWGGRSRTAFGKDCFRDRLSVPPGTSPRLIILYDVRLSRRRWRRTSIRLRSLSRLLNPFQ